MAYPQPVVTISLDEYNHLLKAKKLEEEKYLMALDYARQQQEALGIAVQVIISESGTRGVEILRQNLLNDKLSIDLNNPISVTRIAK